jgi:hypothetical protein
MTPLKLFWRGIGPAETTGIFLKKFFFRNYVIVKQFKKFHAKFQRVHLPRWNDFSRIIDPLKRFHRGHWPRWNDFVGVINPAKTISAGSLTDFDYFRSD